MHTRGNTVLVIIVVIAITLALFLIVPIGGKLGQLREATISFLFRKPPRFISMEADVEGVPQIVKAGESLKIKGGETLIIRKIHANTFFDSYLGADVAGFGKPNDLNEPVDTAEIRDQLMAAGIRSVPIDIYYLDRKIAKVPLEMELSVQDFKDQLEAAKSDEERIAILRSAHASFPKDASFLDMLDRLLTAREDYQSLIMIYKAVSDADPSNMTALANLSRYYIRLGKFDDALAMCTRIVDAGKADAPLYRRMAYIAGEKGDFEGRVSYLKKALELDPGNDEVIVDLAKTYEQAGLNQQAIDVYKSASETAGDREILVPLIKEALKKKDYEKARNLLERYVKRYPQDRNAVAQLAMVMGRLGNTKSQVEYYEKAVSLSPGSNVLWYNLGVAREKQDDPKGALDAYAHVLQMKPGDQDSLRGAARSALKAGQYKDAYGYYGALVKMNGNRENLKGLVSAAVGLKDQDKIIDACTMFLKKNKDHDVAISLAYAYESRAARHEGRSRLDDLSRALEAYKTALSINPRSKVASEKIPELSIETIKLRKSLQ
ncbi:MAG TPA: tetratricopeptide repeat protein [Deltaproteobacteria bacterium]|nr:tetratricopeptide repeat protein [Deltaproteobacteria bacterium]HPR53823.1 tetratricopeptide repeat protein [Deltaproteobacteria bacterium]HXK45977.1 tetratricopeptide repeat protein [Deltaproteobacteria bacterium]